MVAVSGEDPVDGHDLGDKSTTLLERHEIAERAHESRMGDDQILGRRRHLGRRYPGDNSRPVERALRSGIDIARPARRDDGATRRLAQLPRHRAARALPHRHRFAGGKPADREAAQPRSVALEPLTPSHRGTAVGDLEAFESDVVEGIPSVARDEDLERVAGRRRDSRNVDLRLPGGDAVEPLVRDLRAVELEDDVMIGRHAFEVTVAPQPDLEPDRTGGEVRQVEAPAESRRSAPGQDSGIEPRVAVRRREAVDLVRTVLVHRRRHARATAARVR